MRYVFELSSDTKEILFIALEKHLLNNGYSEREVLEEKEILLNSKVDDVEEITAIAGIAIAVENKGWHTNKHNLW